MADETTGREQPLGTTSRSLILGCLTLILLLAGACGVMVVLGKGDTDETEYLAKTVCQGFVKKQLKSPTSARFSEESATKASGRWTVSGVVDSQNSFGAMVRNQYTCTTTYQKDGDQWNLVSLTGLDN